MRRSYEQQEYYEWPASYSNVVNDIKYEYNCKVIVFDNKFLMMMRIETAAVSTVLTRFL
jgi:hypothetical protein